jgi:hypothetical protein
MPVTLTRYIRARAARNAGTKYRRIGNALKWNESQLPAQTEPGASFHEAAATNSTGERFLSACNMLSDEISMRAAPIETS